MHRSDDRQSFWSCSSSSYLSLSTFLLYVLFRISVCSVISSAVLSLRLDDRIQACHSLHRRRALVGTYGTRVPFYGFRSGHQASRFPSVCPHRALHACTSSTYTAGKESTAGRELIDMASVGWPRQEPRQIDRATTCTYYSQFTDSLNKLIHAAVREA